MEGLREYYWRVFWSTISKVNISGSQGVTNSVVLMAASYKRDFRIDILKDAILIFKIKHKQGPKGAY